MKDNFFPLSFHYELQNKVGSITSDMIVTGDNVEMPLSIEYSPDS